MKTSIRYSLILGFVGFVTSFGAHIVAVNLPVYAKQVEIGIAAIGLLIAVYDFAEIIAKPVFGALADRQGMKKTMLAGIILFIIASLLYPTVNPKLLFLIRFMQGIGAAALSAVSLALVGVYYTENRGKAFGIYNAIKGAGYVISPVLGGFLILKSNFSAIFIASAVIGIIAFALSLTLPNHRTGKLDEDDDFSFKSFAGVFKDKKLFRWYAVIVVNMFFVSILFGFLPVRIYSLGYSPLITGILLSIVALSYLLVQPVAGRVADKIDPVITVRSGLILSAVTIIIVPFVSGILLMIVSILAGIGIGTVWTNSDNIVSRLAKQSQLGVTMGAAGSFKEFGDMVGPVLIGILSQCFGLTIGFITCGVLGLFSILLIQDKNAAQ